MPPPTQVLYLTEAEVRCTLDMPEALSLAEAGLRADSARAVAGDKFYMPVGEKGFIKPFSGYAAGEEFAYVKTFSFFPGNPARHNRPATSSMVLLFDAETGLPVCVMEGGWITALKTGASTAVTAAHLARPKAAVVTIFGAGMLGRMHLRALSERFRLDRAYVVDILPDVAEAMAHELAEDLHVPVDAIPLSDRQRAVEQSDLVVTVTTGNQPLVERAWLRPGAFVARLGSYQEVALEVITGADKVVVDNWHYVCNRIPELVTLGERGRFGLNELYAEWPDIYAGRKIGRESPTEIIVYVALGLWGEYATILPEVYRRAVALELGTPLPTG